MLKNGENRQFDTACPFDCTKWEECVCENTDARDGSKGFFGTAQDFAVIEDRARNA